MVAYNMVRFSDTVPDSLLPFSINEWTDRFNCFSSQTATKFFCFLDMSEFPIDYFAFISSLLMPEFLTCIFSLNVFNLSLSVLG